ncbi:porin family protein [Shewanella khirikhana]|uniref:OmpA-like transmembrane domain protein n=1 Tax=Shewanella khirikhana TaxID=1965282 RepID=A0ABN5TW01_9GAMM|nr:porin family protein [Shewanella khirikhana]AZQ11433.1 OmpA-like transmembrane domain protein [Shewanella khirikhana]
MKTAVAVGLISSLMLGSAVAGESPHLLGGSLGYGAKEFESKDGQLYDGGDGVTWDIWYRYMLNDYWGLELGYAGVDGGIMSALIDTISEVRDLSYSGGRVSVLGQYPIYRGGSLYAKAGYGVHQVDYEYQKLRQDENDQGFVGALGYQHRFRSGFGLHAEYQYTPMEKLSVTSFNLGLSWQF